MAANEGQKLGFFSRFTRATVGTRDGLRDMAHVFDVLRAPLMVSLLGVIVFGFPGQIYEIYRLFAEDFTLDEGFTLDNLRFFFFFVMLYAVTYVLWFIARVLTCIDPKIKEALDDPEADGRAARWAPRWIGAAPAFAAAFGLARAEYLREGVVQTPGLYGAAAIAFFIGVLRVWASWRRMRAGGSAYSDIAARAMRRDLRLAFGAVLLGMIGYLLTQPVALTQTVGALSIICFFMVALVYGWSQLTFIYDRYAIPALSLVVGAAVIWSLLDWNDNHFVRELPPNASEVALLEAQVAADVYGPAPPLTVRDAFEDWLDSRADKPAYDAAGEPYPVYIVAAQGGGLYAAYQSAMYMAKLQDECPTFAQHVFGISGVSGGAVGAATFTALSLEHARNQPIESLDEPCGVPMRDAAGAPVSFVDKTREILSQDFLSPVVSGMLFGDFTNLFSPVPIPELDRARALEGAFELAWDRAHPAAEGYPAPPNRLTDGLLDYWDPASPAPALFLNATEAETGRRIVFSPIERIDGSLRTYAAAVEPRADGAIPDLRLSTAAMVSARFPFITPAASLRLKGPQSGEDGQRFPKLRLVDGGYYENSGLETAIDLIRASRPDVGDRSARRRGRGRISEEERRARREALRRFREGVDLRVIVFDLTEDRFRSATYAFGEALTPLKALLNTRVSRSELAQEAARDQLRSPCRYIFLGGGRPPGAGGEDDGTVCLPSEIKRSKVWSVSLNDFEYDFQLGWILSRDTLGRIEEQLGSPTACRPQSPSGPSSLGGPEDAALVAEGAPEQQRRQEQALGFTDGISITEEQSAAPQTEDALARHNSCIGSFVVEQLKIAPPPAPSPSAEDGAAQRANEG